MIQKVYPRVYRSGYRQTLFLKLKAEVTEAVSVRIFGMERYTIPHSPQYRIDEYDRHPFYEAKNLGGGLYSLEYDFPYEQRYRLRIRIGDTILEETEDIYAVEEDLFGLQVFKGDTHLHSNRSDGEGTPFQVGVNYRKAGFDFIAITDHHRMWPSVEAKEAFEQLTELFTVIRAEEVHNRDMGYFHIVNLGGSFSVNDYIEEDHERTEAQVLALMQKENYPPDADPKACAFRQFIAEKIHEGGGLAVMAHPFWICFDEYNVQYPDLMYAWRKGQFDALEVLAGNPQDGDNLTAALWAQLRAEGLRIPVVGASDSHSCTSPDSLFDRHLTLVFARDRKDILSAIREGRSVAVDRRSDSDYFIVGDFRLVKYGRFLMDAFYPGYRRLTQRHGAALEAALQRRTPELEKTEKWIAEYREEFFA